MLHATLQGYKFLSFNKESTAYRESTFGTIVRMVDLQAQVLPTYPPSVPVHSNEPNQVSYHQSQPGSAHQDKTSLVWCLYLEALLYQYLDSHLSFVILRKKEKATLYVRKLHAFPLLSLYMGQYAACCNFKYKDLQDYKSRWSCTGQQRTETEKYNYFCFFLERTASKYNSLFLEPTSGLCFADISKKFDKYFGSSSL